MSKESKYLFLISFILVFFLGMVLYIVEISNKSQKNKKEDYIEFYAVITDVLESSYEIKQYKNFVFLENYEVLYVNLNSKLNKNDVIKIKAKDQIMESYPPQINIISFDVIIDSNENKKLLGSFIHPLGIENFKTNEHFLAQLETLIDTVKKEKSNNKYIKQIIDNYVYLIDFLITENTLGGIKYKDLENNEKLTIIKNMIEYDNLIRSDIPKIYENSIDNIITLYLDEIVNICRIDNCNEEKKQFQKYKNELNIEWDYLSNINHLSNEKLSEWYLIYNGK